MPTVWTFYSVSYTIFPWSGQVTKPAQIQRSGETNSILLRGGSTMAYYKGAWTQGDMDTGERCSLEAIVITSLSFQIMLYHRHIFWYPYPFCYIVSSLQLTSFVRLLFPFATITDLEHCFVSAEFLMDDERSKRKVGKN